MASALRVAEEHPIVSSPACRSRNQVLQTETELPCHLTCMSASRCLRMHSLTLISDRKG